MVSRQLTEIPPPLNRGIFWVALAATFYNTLLAIVNAHMFSIGVSIVAAVEILILFTALIIILVKGLYRDDLSPFLYLILTLALTIYVSVINKSPIIDYFRNILILFCFITLGTWINNKTIKTLFMTVCILILAGLLFEIFFEGAYGDLFYPALYFENTRNIPPLEISNSKLFRNALGFEGRFTFGIIGHRSSSLFLEQVSLANFSGVMMIYLTALWGSFSRFQRFLSLLTIVLILVTNDSRTMLIFGFVSFVGYFVFPYMPRMFSFLVMPIILLAGLLVYILKPDAEGDDIPGRIVLTIKHFIDLDLLAYLGFNANSAAAFGDSGYIYVIIIGTFFSLLLLWVFVTFYPACRHPDERRFAHSLSIFIFMNMMIGGTAIFSIKIAGLLWLLAGYLKFSRQPRE